jgi:hypothetical protein
MMSLEPRRRLRRGPRTRRCRGGPGQRRRERLARRDGARSRRATAAAGYVGSVGRDGCGTAPRRSDRHCPDLVERATGRPGSAGEARASRWSPTAPRTARGRVVEQSADEIEIGGVRVRRGDYVLADKTAIVFLPAEKTEVVVTSAEAIVAREAAMATALARGLSAASVMGLAYEELLSRIAPDGK